MSSGNDKRIVWRGRHLNLVMRGRWEYVERRNVTGIVGLAPVTDDGKLVLVEQYRPPVDARVIELPAGLAGDRDGHEHEPLEAAARRELLEETGYEAGTLRRIFQGAASAGVSGERMTFFLATDLRKVGPGGGDESEDITVHEAPLEGLVDWLSRRELNGAVIDLKIYAALPFCPRGPGR